VKISRAIPAPTTLIAPGRSFGTAGISLLGGAASDLTAFLSLVTGFLEKNPTATLGRIMPLPFNPSDAAGASVSKDKSKDLTSGLNKDTEGGLNKEPTGGVNKDSKNHKKEESLAMPQPARPLPTALAFPAKTPVAIGFPTPQPGLAGWGEQFSWSQNGNTGGSAQHPEIALHPLVTALPALPAVAGVVAFALRLSPSSSETINTLQAVIPAMPLAGSSARVPSLELAQTALAASKESIARSTPVSTEVGPKPPPEAEPWTERSSGSPCWNRCPV
jgi:hypothetical protein